MHAQDLAQEGFHVKPSLLFTETRPWIRVTRDMWNHPVVGAHVKPPKAADPKHVAIQPMLMWQWMIMEAGYAERKRVIMNQPLLLQRGQFAASQRFMADALNWTRKGVRLWLAKLVRFGMITVRTEADTEQLILAFPELIASGPDRGQPLSVITLCNYDKHQNGYTKQVQSRAKEGPRRGQGGAQTITNNTRIQTEDIVEGAAHVVDAQQEEPEAVLVRLDDHRPPKMEASEEQCAAFRKLCDTFGRKAGAIVLSPTSREDSDPVIQGMIRSELTGVPHDIAMRAIDAALRAATAHSIADRQDGHAGKSGGGMARLVAYLEKSLRPKADALQIAEAATRANVRTEQAVQERVAQKRMSGVETGGQTRPRGRSSWEDLGAEVYGTAEM